MTKLILKNHQIVEEKQAQLSLQERGFLFGDGIFETCKIFNGKIYDYAAHEARLKEGLKALKFSAEIENLEKKSLELIAKNKIKNGILKILISRGVGSAGYLPTYESKALIIVQTFEERELPKKITLGISKIAAPKAFAKTTNSLPYIMTKIGATEENLFDAVMLFEKKFVAETSSANIFWVKNGKIFTAAKTCGILLGTVRKKLLKLSPVKIFETEATVTALKKADEIFLTNSSFLVLPVDEFLGRKLQKNFGKEFLKLLQKDLEKQCSS
jgi:branched-subunit amino acid aminotransferase/4-amino-4-deoxychorismate lyase